MVTIIFNGHHEFTLYSANIQFEYSVGNQSPLVMEGKSVLHLPPLLLCFTTSLWCVTVWWSPSSVFEGNDLPDFVQLVEG